jgi:hypothetical protein
MLNRTVKGAAPVIVELESGVVLKTATGRRLPSGRGVGKGVGAAATVTGAEQRAVWVAVLTVNEALYAPAAV